MTENPDLIKHMLKGIAKGTAKHFSVTDSDYLNITLDSTEEIKAMLESRGGMISLQIESSKEGINTTDITIGGLKPDTTYHLYEDHLYNHTEFKADENGSFSFAQDISKPHLVFILTNTSTYYLKEVNGVIGFYYSSDDVNFTPANIGTWDPVTRIARLTQDINQTLEIDIDSATLTGLKPDNTKHVINASFTIGIFVNNKHDIAIENIEIIGCNSGISINQSTNILIQNNSINNNLDGIDFYYCELNAIRYNSIYNNSFGIIISEENKFNVIQNNEIYDCRSIGIFFGKNNVSNTIQYNNIYKNSEGGIDFFDSGNNSNIILCNRISNNEANNPPYTVGGANIFGDNNLIKHNNFINNKPYNAYNKGTNTYTSNYWDDWDMVTIPYAFPVDGADYSPAAFPVSCTLFKQFSVQEQLTIPEQKPCAEEIIKCHVGVEICHVKVIKTPKAQSHEGQVLKGYKAIIHGNLHQKLEYIADEPTQSVHAAHFITPFSTYIMLEEDYVMGTPLHITPTLEDVYYKLLDKRHVFKNVTLYLEAKET